MYLHILYEAMRFGPFVYLGRTKAYYIHTPNIFHRFSKVHKNYYSLFILSIIILIYL